MANIARFDPFNNIVDDLFRGFLVRPVAYDAPALKLEVTEKNGTYQVTADLPGVRKEDIQVAVDGAQVTLSAEVKRETGCRRRTGACIPSARSARYRAVHAAAGTG
jgi:HSP20 family protein